MKQKPMKRTMLSLGITVAIAAGSLSAITAQAAPNNTGKYLIAWMGDQMLDGNNCSPLDNVLALRGGDPSLNGMVDENGDPVPGSQLPNGDPIPDSTADCTGVLPDADFIGIIDADPKSDTYGQVVNTAEMPAVAGAHLLSDTDDFVDEALDLAIALGDNGLGDDLADPGYAGSGGLEAVGLGASVQGDILGGVPNFGYGLGGTADALGLDPVVEAPSSVLNEPHHHSVYPYVAADGSVNSYYGGLISSNIFGCDISDPLNIKPSPGTTLENVPVHADNTDNVCGLSATGRDLMFSGADDLEYNPANQKYYTTMMGAGGSFAGAYSPTSASGSSLPPVLTTPGGILVFDPSTDTQIFEVSAVPTAPVYGHGYYVNGEPMLGPKRYAPRKQISMGGVDGNGECTPGDIPTAVGVDVFNLCVPGVTPHNQIGADTGAVNLDAGINEGPDTGLLAHPHGIGLRTDLNGTMADADGNVVGTTNGILMTSDYADPVSLALQSPGQGAEGSHQNFGTTIRLWDLSNAEAGPYQVIQMPDGPRHEFNEVQEEAEGLMAMRMTHSHKGAFVASMNGGMLYYSSDITIPKPVFKGIYDFGACTGASVFTITQDDKHMFLPVSGMQMAGDPVYERDYAGQHDGRIAVLDLKALLNAGDDYECDFAPASAWDNTGPDSPLGQPETQGPSGIVAYSNPGDMMDGNDMHPNNGASDCPKLVDQVNLGGAGEDGIVGGIGAADDHPDSVTTRGGPHFTTHDRNDRYVATSNYFVDLREFAIKDIDLLLSALGVNHGFDNSNSDSGTNAYPPGGPTTCTDVLGQVGGCPQGGLGMVHELLGVDGGFGNTLPGLGSVGDDTICMMKWNRKKQNLKLDERFNAGDTTSPTGCNDMDFGDTGRSWPVAGARNPGAGNGTPHGMSFVKVGASSWFTNGEL